MITSSTLNVPDLDHLLHASAVHHHKICPRQVLGVRIGLLAGRVLEIPLPQPEKRMLAIAETDGCFVDGISAATGCYVGRRTLRIEDYGKTAAVFIDTLAEQAIRIVPRGDVRELAGEYAPSARNKWEAQLIGYQRIPDELLLHWQSVELTVPVKQIIGQSGKRVSCEICGEEVINEREVSREGMVMCRSCAGESYFRFMEHWAGNQRAKASVFAPAQRRDCDSPVGLDCSDAAYRLIACLMNGKLQSKHKPIEPGEL